MDSRAYEVGKSNTRPRAGASASTSARTTPMNGEADTDTDGDMPHISYQDFMDDLSEFEEDSDEGDGVDDETYAQLIKEAEEAFSEDESTEMLTFLKERGMIAFVKHYVSELQIPASKLLLAFGVLLAPSLRANASDDDYLDLLKMTLARALREREKLPQYNTISDALKLIRGAKRIMVLTGAGISVSCGIPDFRSEEGIYAQLKTSAFADELDDPQQMFDLKYFRKHPTVFYSFAHRIYPSHFTPSPCHYFIKLLEDKGKLLRNYTQNIDTLESVAGVQNVLHCHGSFATASCITCGHRVPGSAIKDDVMAKRIPHCKVCGKKPKEKPKPKGKKARTKPWEEEDTDEEMIDDSSGIMKPDITFFGEKLDDRFDRALFEDREKVDLLLIIGTSLSVAPVSEILYHIPHSVPQILINKTPVRHVRPDIVLRGEADEVVCYLCHHLNWELPVPTSRTKPKEIQEPERLDDTHVWLFKSAEKDTLGKNLRATYTRPAKPTKSSSSDDDLASISRATSMSDFLRVAVNDRDGGFDSDASKSSKKRRLV